MLVMAASMLWSGISILAIPHTRSVVALILAFTTAHLGLGAMEAGNNLFIRRIWGQESAPFLQLLEFVFGMGSLLAPVVAVPFLVESDESGVGANSTTGREAAVDLRLVYPYSLIAGVSLVSSVCAIVLWSMSPETPVHVSREATKESVKQRTSGWKVLLVLMTMLFMHLYLGVESSLSALLTTFTVKAGGSKSQGAHLTTLYWVSFTFFPVVSLLVREYTGSAVVVVVMSLSLMLVANTGLLFPFGEESMSLLWLGIGLQGCGQSSLWSFTFSFLEEFLLLSSLASSAIVVSALVGELVFPALASRFIDSYPRILLGISLSCCLTMCVLFVCMAGVCHLVLGRRTTTTSSTRC